MNPPPYTVRMTRADYDRHLARALRQLSVSHPLYTILITVQTGHASGAGPITIAGVAAALGMDYTSIKNHTHLRQERSGSRAGKGSPHLFDFDRSIVPYKIALSAEGIELVVQVQTLVNRFASQLSRPPFAPNE